MLSMVIRQEMLLAFIGISLGVAGALALSAYLESLLFGVSPNGPLTFARAG